MTRANYNKPLMRTYATLTGGGIKGAALAGAVAEAERHGIVFEAFGGSSAGAMVATMFAVGYSGLEILDLLKTKIKPNAFLDDHGAEITRLDSLRIIYLEIKVLLRSGIGFWAILSFFWRNKDHLDRIRPLEQLGLYQGNSFLALFEALLRASPKLKAEKGELTFGLLKDRGCRKLKVIAANLTKKEAISFSADTHPQMSVIKAVQASMSYPLIFAPVLHEQHWFTDGGLASNLPVFAFKNDHAQTGYPILAFDIEEPAGPQGATYDLSNLIPDLINCALEASDQLLMRFIPGVDVVPIRFERRVGTFRLDVTERDIEEMYNWGQKSVVEYLKSYQRWKMAKEAGEGSDSIRKQAQSLFALPKLVEPILWAVKEMVEQVTKAKGVRVALALPAPQLGPDKWLTSYAYGFGEDSKDSEFEFDSTDDRLGLCVKNKVPILFDLVDNPIQGMSDSQKAIICFPVVPEQSAPEGFIVRGLLWIDSNTSLAETDWITEAPKGLEPGQDESYTNQSIRSRMLALGTGWAETLYAIRSYGR